jgi:hypothetical protein
MRVPPGVAGVDDGRVRARGQRGDGESTWAAVVSDDHEFATALEGPRRERDDED